jgi:hypothetical protein
VAYNASCLFLPNYCRQGKNIADYHSQMHNPSIMPIGQSTITGETTMAKRTALSESKSEPETFLLLPAAWAKGLAFVTESYLGEDTPELLKQCGIILEDDLTLEEETQLLYGS